MKVEIKAEEKTISKSYPYIGRHKEVSNLIVLFTSSDSGICLSVGDTGNEKGEYSEEWRESHFIPFQGTITISND